MKIEKFIWILRVVYWIVLIYLFWHWLLPDANTSLVAANQENYPKATYYLLRACMMGGVLFFILEYKNK